MKYLLLYYLGKNHKDFQINVIAKVDESSEFGSTVHNLDDYLSGKINDLKFIQENIKQRQESIRDSGEKVFILDGESYGTDIDSFIKALNPNKIEESALQYMLEKVQEPELKVKVLFS